MMYLEFLSKVENMYAVIIITNHYNLFFYFSFTSSRFFSFLFSILKDIKFCTKSSLKVNRCFGVTCLLHIQRRIIRQRRNYHEAGSKQTSSSSTLKMKATCSSETSVDLQRTTWRFIPENKPFFLSLLFFFSSM
jgi:hypothetical protein